MLRSYQGIKTYKGDSISVDDQLMVESPLTISINGEPLTVTMQTPGAEWALAAGLLWTEGITKKKLPNDLTWHFEPDKFGVIQEVKVRIQDREDAISNKRSLMSIASCGICGKTNFEIPVGEALTGKAVAFDFDQLWLEFQSKQTMFQASGGSHAAAIVDRHGAIISAFEDIGRHNAVDKCIGDLWLKEKLSSAQVLMVSGRISYEIISKAFMARIPAIAAVSAPSSMAVDFAKEWGIMLWGFCREGRKTRYA